MKSNRLPQHITSEDKVILFDGICKLCSFWARFIIKYDARRRFILSAVQSVEGQDILQYFGLSTEKYETMVLVEGEKLYVKSSAFIRIVYQLPFPWPLLAAFWIIPYPIRDWLYSKIALNRYKLFGKYESCLLPKQDHQSRFLKANND